MKIQILGMGCPKCLNLGETTAKAAQNLGLDFTLEKVTDMAEIVKTGVLSTPALVVDGKILSQGKLPAQNEIEALLKSCQS